RAAEKLGVARIGDVFSGLIQFGARGHTGFDLKAKFLQFGLRKAKLPVARRLPAYRYYTAQKQRRELQSHHLYCSTMEAEVLLSERIEIAGCEINRGAVADGSPRRRIEESDRYLRPGSDRHYLIHRLLHYLHWVQPETDSSH